LNDLKRELKKKSSKITETAKKSLLKEKLEKTKITLLCLYLLEHIFKKMGSTEIVVSSVRPSPISQPL
jgi:hypothetical protein